MKPYIKCTKEQKRWIIESIDLTVSNNCNGCPALNRCQKGSMMLDCKAELNTAIEWDIIE